MVTICLSVCSFQNASISPSFWKYIFSLYIEFSLGSYFLLAQQRYHPAVFFFFFWGLMFVLIYLLLLEQSHFGLDSDPEVEALREDSLCLSSLFLAFFFGLFYSLSQNLSIFCGLFLTFLSTSFLQINVLFVLLYTWSCKILNLGCFGPRFLLCLGDFSYHIGRYLL